MRACLNIKRFLAPFLPQQPKPRLQQLFRALNAALRGKKLSLTALGRNLMGKAQVKNKIKALYRLLTHPGLQKDLPKFYQAIARALVLPGTQPLLLVDWTPCGKNHYALVAALAHDGRAIPLYIEIHHTSTYGCPTTEHAFLDMLQTVILPPNTRPVLVTDCGYRTPWFQHVRSLGWTAIGRITGNVLVRDDAATADIWLGLKLFHRRASTTPRSHGLYWVAKTNPMRLQLVVYKGEAIRAPSQRRGPTRLGDYTTRGHRQKAAEPWMLVCTEPSVTAETIVQWYRCRMQIEETFRDDKNRDTGLGLNGSGSHHVAPLSALRLIGALATVLTHLVGVLGEQHGWHRHYQVNTVSERRVLSLPFLGRQILQHADLRKLTNKRLQEALTQVHEQSLASSNYWMPKI